MGNIEDVYKAPTAELNIKQQLPEMFVAGNFTRRKLQVVGWLTILYTILVIPIVILSFLKGRGSLSDVYIYLEYILSALSTILFIYTILVFRRFLNIRLEYYGVNLLVLISVILSIPLYIVSLFLHYDNPYKVAIGITYFTLLVVSGIIELLIGKRLFSIRDKYAYITLYSWLNMAAGLCMATVILLVFAIPLDFIGGIILAFIFFNGAKELSGATRA